jgi:predicted Zn-dependent peptidase
MNFKLTTFVCLMLLVTNSILAKDYNYTTVKGDLMGTRIYTLNNGLKVYMSVNNEKPRLKAYIAVRVGSKNDPAETTGLSHYLEHLMFKGTTHYGVTDPVQEAPLLDSIQNRYEQYRHTTDLLCRKAIYHKIDSLSQVASQYNIPNEYDKLMQIIGSEESNAYTGNDVTCYTEDIPSNQIENWARIQSDRFMNMTIRGFHTELEAVYEEKNITMTRDGEKQIDSLFNILYPNHPYGTQSTIGLQEHLKNPSIVNIKKHFNTWYRPNNVAICLAGDFDPDIAIAIIDKYFKTWMPNKDIHRLEFKNEPVYSHPVEKTVVGQEAESVLLGWRFDGVASPQTDTLTMIENILSNGTAGLFDLNLNLQQQVQQAEAGVYGLADYSSFVMQGMPKEGQSLEQVRYLMLGELNKLKKGEFSEDLISAIINNLKLKYFQGLLDNGSRVNCMVDAFIDGELWKNVVGEIGRYSKITKNDIVSFANRYFTEGYAVVYKRIGEDTNQRKIEKPEITPISSNRELSSQFLRDIQNVKVIPIQPKFVDFKKDITLTKTVTGIPVIYKQNTADGLFNISFVYPFGTTADLKMSYAANYLDYVGTDKMTAAQVKQAFYKLACSWNISVGDKETFINLSGLNDKMPEALSLLTYVLDHAKGDKVSYDKYVAAILKNRVDNKTNQNICAKFLKEYGEFGKYNSCINIFSDNQLKSQDPQQLLDELKKLFKVEHKITYFGSDAQSQFLSLISKVHKTPKKLLPAPLGKEYTRQVTSSNKVLFAPYEAKNFYMLMLHNENKSWNLENMPVEAVFNEYFSGGNMNSIVFSEMRETRALAYSAYANYTLPYYKNKPESYMTYIISQSDKLKDCVTAFNQLLDSLPKSPSLFELCKTSLYNSLSSKRVTRNSVIDAYLSAQRLGINQDASEYVYNHLSSVTLDDMINFEKTNMANKKYTYVILGDEKGIDFKYLNTMAPVEKLTLKDIFGY